MRKDDKASVSTLRIVIITIALLLCSGIGAVLAVNSNATSVKVVFPNNYELNVITTKTKISEILEEKHIALMEDEITSPKLNENLGEEKTILISKKEVEHQKYETQETETLNIENIKDLYGTVIEKIETFEVEIPYETVTKDVSGEDAEEKTTKIIQEGENGLKVVTYKVTYKNDIEIDRLEIESKIVKQPVNKIVQVNSKTLSRLGTDRTISASNNIITSSTSLAQKVEGMEPKVVTLNTSAYTAATCGKSENDSSYGITSSGKKAKAWYTVAAGKGYAIGTVIYIPYFEDAPNGGWFVVEDRGGAITNGKLDVYMNTYNECRQFGRRNLECYIYEF